MSCIKEIATSGVFSGAIGVTLPYPFDVVRTRQQANVISEIRVSRALFNLYKSSGFFHLFKGYSCSILFYCPASAIYYCAYENSRRKMRLRFRNCSESFLEGVAGFIAISTGMLLWTPMDNIAQKCQCGGKSDTPSRIARQILKSEGFRGFYRGFNASVLSAGPQCGLFWSLYESSKRAISPFYHECPTTQFVCALLGATGSVFLTNPIDVVRCQIQTDVAGGSVHLASKESICRAIKTVVKKEGLRNLWFKGLRARCLVAVPDYVAGILTFEFAFQQLTGFHRDVELSI